MAEIRSSGLLVGKFVLMIALAVLMIIWIFLAVYSVSEINRLDSDHRNSNNRPKTQQQLGAYESGTYTRMRGMTIFNTILEEVIALLAMIGAGYLHHYLLQTTSVLLSIIWLIVHYRINELLWYGSPLLIASHVIHFVVAVFALVFTYFCAVKSPGFGSRKSLTNGSVGAAPE